MDKYYARICWNDNDWKFPSGEKREHRNDYVSRTGFGHEEWLFNFAWLIDGYHYTFLQPVSKSFKKATGRMLAILLYSIRPNRDRIYVGQINNCHVLTPGEADTALKHYRKSGWLKSMKEQIREAGGDAARIDTDALSVFNVRFRPTDADYSLRLAEPTDFITKLNRYTLVKADPLIVQTQRGGRRKGTNVLPKVQTITRSGQSGAVYDPIHPELQRELMKLLKVRFGHDNIVRESDFVDITINHGNRTTLVEIKSDSQARIAIREALGQLLEYAYFGPNSRNDSTQLVIVAPGPMTKPVSDYLKRLRAKFDIPVTYCAFSLGDKLPSVFGDDETQGLD